MVGNKESDRNKRHIYAQLYCIQRCGGVCPSGTCILECGDSALEGEPLANDVDAENQITTEARSEAGLYDSLRSSPISMVRSTHPASGKVFYHWVVHGIETECDHGTEVVDGES